MCLCSAAIITAYLMRTERLSLEGLNKLNLILEYNEYALLYLYLMSFSLVSRLDDLHP